MGCECETKTRRAPAVFWGLFLVALGVAFLLERAGVLPFGDVWQLWPVVFWVIAVNNAWERRWGSALMFLLLGAAFLAANYNWWGLTYSTSWPLILVAVGVGMVVRSLTGEQPRRRRVEDAKHD
jgi:hypothetical protein